jgi:hypothetical protein
MTGGNTPKQTPTAAEEAHARAYLSGVAYGFGITFDDWTGWGDGTATTFIDDSGVHLIFTGDELHPFDAVIPCNGHRRHRVGVTWPHELDKAREVTAECSAKADPPTVTLRPVAKPTPLWLITRAADTPGEDRRSKPAS